MTTSPPRGAHRLADEGVDPGGLPRYEDGGPSTQQRRRGLFRRAPIRAKLALILVVPLIAVFALAGLRTWDATEQASVASRTQRLADLGVQLGDFVHALQQERGLAAGVLAAPKRITFRTQITVTESAASRFRDQVRQLDEDTLVPISEPIARVQSQIPKLAALRGSVLGRTITIPAANYRYTRLITDLLAVNSAIAVSSTDRDLSDQLQAVATFAAYKEYTSQEQALLFNSLAAGSFGPGQRNLLVDLIATRNAYLDQFATEGSAAQRYLVDTTLVKPVVQSATLLESRALNTAERAKIGIDPQAWLQSTAAQIDLMHGVERSFGKQISELAEELRAEATTRTMIGILTALFTLAAAVTVSLLIARSLIRPLAKLRTSALDVAYKGLPEAVRRLQDVEHAQPDDPRLEDPSSWNRPTRAVEVASNDEIGQVAEAFNAIHHEAVRVATDQAMLRQSVSTMFVNLSRRSQLLVDRLIRLIDTLEEGERDPDRLAELFKLDHLATRMRRNDENLLVLAGGEASVRRTQPAALRDVLRAGIAEVDQYTRVRLANVDNRIEVAPAAVNDIVHLIAELLENATSYSAPRTEVLVDARATREGSVVEITDQGIGMSAQSLAALNERLAGPPVIDVTVSKTMGLFVVGRLAARHGIRVMLRNASGGGLLSIVTIPSSALHSDRPTTPALPANFRADYPQATERPQVPAGYGSATGPAPVAAGYRPVAAIESGRMAPGGMPPGGMAPGGMPGGLPPGGMPGGLPPGVTPGGMPPAAYAPMSSPSPVAGGPPRMSPGAAPTSGPPFGSPAGSPFAPPEPAMPVSGAGFAPSFGAPTTPPSFDRTGTPSSFGAPPPFAPPSQSTPPSAFPPPSQPGPPSFGAPTQSNPAPSSFGSTPTGPSGFTPREPGATTAFTPSGPSPRQSGPGEQPPAFGAPTGPPPYGQRPTSPDAPSPFGAGRRPDSAFAPEQTRQEQARQDDTGEQRRPTDIAAAFRSAGDLARRPGDGASNGGPPAYGEPTAARLPVLGDQPTGGAPDRPAWSETAVPATGPQPAAEETTKKISMTDATVEMALPIFEAIESEWFRVRTPAKPAPDAEPAGPDADGRPAPSTTGLPRREPGSTESTGFRPAEPYRPPAFRPQQPTTGPSAGPSTTGPASTTPSTTPAGTPEPAAPPRRQPVTARAAGTPALARRTPGATWSSPADVGWQAATAAAEPTVSGTTSAGLPKRIPMAHFVPGGVGSRPAATGTTPPKRMSAPSPDAIRGVLSSYRAGLEQGRQAGTGKPSKEDS